MDGIMSEWQNSCNSKLQFFLLLPVFFAAHEIEHFTTNIRHLLCNVVFDVIVVVIFFASLLTLLQLSIISVQAFLVKACFFCYSLNSSIGSLDKSRACVTIKIVNFSSSFCSYWQILSVCLSVVVAWLEKKQSKLSCL